MPRTTASIRSWMGKGVPANTPSCSRANTTPMTRHLAECGCGQGVAAGWVGKES